MKQIYSMSHRQIPKSRQYNHKSVYGFTCISLLYQLASATFVYVVFLPGLELPREACIKRIKKLYSVYSTHKRIL